MAPEEIRSIRGALSRAAFARRLGVTPLTVLRWELPDGNKEARRPRPKMIEAMRKLAADGVGVEVGAASEEEEDEPDVGASEPAHEADASPIAVPVSDDDALVLPLLDRLNTESWPTTEDRLFSLLSSGALATSEGRVLATLGVVQAQMFGRYDLRGALTTLLPILEEAELGRTPRAVAARAHVLASLPFSSPDARFFDPGRVNAHVARAQALLDSSDPGVDDLRVFLAVAAMGGARFLGPHVQMRTYQAHAPALARASHPLARMLTEMLHHVAALLREDRAAAARHKEACFALLERLRAPHHHITIFAAHAHQAMNGLVSPEEILALVEAAKAQSMSARIPPSDELFRLYSCEIAAYIRLGRFVDAEAAYHAAIAAARRDGQPIRPLAAVACYLFLMLHRRDELEALADELESEGAPRAGPNHHAFLVRASALFLTGDVEHTAEAAEVVCTAPETAPGIDELRQQGFYGLVVMRMAQGDAERTRAAIRRFQALLGERPSAWHSAVLRRLEGLFALLFEGRVAEARQRLESVRSAFRLLGDVTELAFADLNLAVVARAAGARDAEERIAAAAQAIRALGLPNAPLLEWVPRARPQANTDTWSEETLCERLVIAMDRLSVRGLRAEQLHGEITSIARELFPGHTVEVGRATLGGATSKDGVDVPDGEGGLLRVGVDGDLSGEQLAALRLLTALVPASPAAAGAPRVTGPTSDPYLPSFIAAAPATRLLKREIAQLSRSSATILIAGESGSGKEVVARGVHDLSSRAERPYVAFNCASVPRDLFEGQLFGYKKGAFTGATSDNPGVIRAADGGTLFLDEIAELPLDTQPKLLRFLENGEIHPFGEQKPRRVDVRVLAATHRDLGRLVREGLFREDLYYRLNVVPLSVPPLRQRVEDVLPLALMFIERLAPEGQERPELGANAVAALEAYSWPGNVRELRNVIERAMAYAPVPLVLDAEHLRIGRK